MPPLVFLHRLCNECTSRGPAHLAALRSTLVGISRDGQRIPCSHSHRCQRHRGPKIERRVERPRQGGTHVAPVIPCSTIHDSALKVEIRICAPLEDAPRGVKVAASQSRVQNTGEALQTTPCTGRLPSQQAAALKDQKPPDRHTSIRHLASLVSTRSKP